MHKVVIAAWLLLASGLGVAQDPKK